MLCLSIRRWAWLMAAWASFRFGLPARASSRAIRRSTGCSSAASAARGSPLAAGVDAVLPAHRLEGRAVRGLIVGLQHLVDELVGDLVLEHLAHDRPTAAPRPACG